MTVGKVRRFWRHMSGYYDARRSDVVRAYNFHSMGAPAPLEAIAGEIAEDGDVQWPELLWLRAGEVTE